MKLLNYTCMMHRENMKLLANTPFTTTATTSPQAAKAYPRPGHTASVALTVTKRSS